MTTILKYVSRLPLLRRVNGYLREAYTGSKNPEMFPRGHYYSPLPDLDYVARESRRLFARDVDVGAFIPLREEEQLRLLETLAEYVAEFDWGPPSGNRRFHLEQTWFCEGDALILYCLLRHLEPTRVIEVGSGFSSALMLDTRERQSNGHTHFTFIEPFTDRLRSTLRSSDQEVILEKPVQETDLALFSELGSGDMLFIDSSHVSKIGSDVNFLLFEVLPRLRKGVIVHFHDIFWPFEYPKSWVQEGRAWNEAYILRAFLQFNEVFEIMLFNSFVGFRYSDWLDRHMPLFNKNTGGSLWLRKVV